MITKVLLPSKADLEELINEALQDGSITPIDFITNHCKGVIHTLEQDPALYRAYGGYWWAVKRILNNQGYGKFLGSDFETITADHFLIEDDMTTLCAAWYYWNYNLESGYQYNPIHVYSYEKEEEDVQFEYSLEDVDMEAKIVNISMQ